MHNHCCTGERGGQFLQSTLFHEMVRLIYLLICYISCFQLILEKRYMTFQGEDATTLLLAMKKMKLIDRR